jgi:pimeloyl-ACP methyl ester carboxylesterase
VPRRPHPLPSGLRAASRPRLALLPTALALVLGISGCGRAGIDGFYDVAGGQVDLWCDGGDGPTVMFVAAIGGDHTLVPIAEEMADEAYVCFYDRPGDGETEPPEGRRTAAEDAADLHELIALAEIPAPIVLVAHSYGGLVTMVVAAEHPEDISGVVLVDSSHPDQEHRFDEVLTDAQREEDDTFQRDNFPYIDWYPSLDDAARAMPDFPDLPLTVLSASEGFLRECEGDLPCEEMQEIWLGTQTELAELTPDARQVVTGTRHYIHDEDPDLVLDEIRALIERTRAAE